MRRCILVLASLLLLVNCIARAQLTPIASFSHADACGFDIYPLPSGFQLTYITAGMVDSKHLLCSNTGCAPSPVWLGRAPASCNSIVLANSSVDGSGTQHITSWGDSANGGLIFYDCFAPGCSNWVTFDWPDFAGATLLAAAPTLEGTVAFVVPDPASNSLRGRFTNGTAVLPASFTITDGTPLFRPVMFVHSASGYLVVFAVTNAGVLQLTSCAGPFGQQCSALVVSDVSFIGAVPLPPLGYKRARLLRAVEGAGQFPYFFSVWHDTRSELILGACSTTACDVGQSSVVEGCLASHSLARFNEQLAVVCVSSSGIGTFALMAHLYDLDPTLAFSGPHRTLLVANSMNDDDLVDVSFLSDGTMGIAWSQGAQLSLHLPIEPALFFLTPSQTPSQPPSPSATPSLSPSLSPTQSATPTSSLTLGATPSSTSSSSPSSSPSITIVPSSVATTTPSLSSAASPSQPPTPSCVSQPPSLCDSNSVQCVGRVWRCSAVSSPVGGVGATIVVGSPTAVSGDVVLQSGSALSLTLSTSAAGAGASSGTTADDVPLSIDGRLTVGTGSTLTVVVAPGQPVGVPLVLINATGGIDGTFGPVVIDSSLAGLDDCEELIGDEEQTGSTFAVTLTVERRQTDECDGSGGGGGSNSVLPIWGIVAASVGFCVLCVCLPLLLIGLCVSGLVMSAFRRHQRVMSIQKSSHRRNMSLSTNTSQDELMSF